jgi:hypothetical protein
MAEPAGIVGTPWVAYRFAANRSFPAAIAFTNGVKSGKATPWV